MSGPFYGSLAASASVFVAILTALLVNNYVTIKSDRRQVNNELNRIQEELEGLRDQRDNHQETVDALIEKRESDYREKAEENVDELVENITLVVSKPIEKLSVDELYQELLNRHDCDSAKELEEKPFRYRHREIIEERMDEIEEKILNDIIPAFASKYEGEGWSPDPDSEFSNLVEAMQKKEDSKDKPEEGLEDRSEIDVKAEPSWSDVLELEDFIDEYKQTHDLDALDEKSKLKLEEQYNKVVDKKTYSDSPSSPLSHRLNAVLPGSTTTGPLRNLLDSNPYSSSLNDPPLSREDTDPFEHNISSIGFDANGPILGLTPQEEQKLEEKQKELRDVKNEIQILEQRQNRLERQKDRLHPEDLVPILTANMATILLSVVIPIFAYLLFVTNTAVTVPDWAWILSHTEANIFFSWLLGLLVVFESIHARITDRVPRAYSLYNRVRGRLSGG